MIIGWVAKYVGAKFAPFLVWGLAIAALFGALWWLRHDAYGDGKRAERAAWEQKSLRLQAEANRLQRIADQLRTAAAAADAARITRQRQEVENAIANIPDQRTSPRQHARACLELRRQGQNPPACQSQPAR